MSVTRKSAWYQLGKFAKRDTAQIGGMAGAFLALAPGVIGTRMGLLRHNGLILR